VIELAQDFAFSHKTLDGFGVVGQQFRLEPLDRHRLARSGIPAQVDLAHPAGGEELFLNKTRAGRPEGWH
jgi:hypothetical protein